MKIFRLVPFAAALALFASCQKQQTDEERRAEVDRQVQQRLDAEHNAADQQRLAQQSADLDAREKALTDKRTTAAATPTATPRREVTQSESRNRLTSGGRETQQSYDTFYRKLEPYGAWRETSDYGYVWQPKAARESRDWRPYTDGRWTYTDAGWTWASDEPFGWATYHYGRWTRLSGVGWVWVPGDEWAPAWVSWREGGDHVGWAPLPPEAHFDKGKGIKKWADSYYDIDADEYVFVPDEYIGAENVQRYALPPQQNVTIVNQTTNVTNITYSNETVMNQGPSYDELRGRSREAVPRLRLDREYDAQREQGGHARIVGDTLAIVAPMFANRANEKPRTEGTPMTEVRRDRNWAGGNQAEAQRAQQKMRSEATAPSDAPARRYQRPTGLNEAAPAASATAGTATPVAQPQQTPAVSATPRFSPRAPITATPAATATPATTPHFTPRAVTTPTPTATSSATATPISTPRSTEAPTTTPRSTPLPVATPASTPTPRATTTPSATIHATPTASPATRDESTTAASPAMQPPLGQGVRERRDLRREQEDEIRRRATEERATAIPRPTSAPAATTSPATAQEQPTPPAKPQPRTTPAVEASTAAQSPGETQERGPRDRRPQRRAAESPSPSPTRPGTPER